MQLTKWIYPTFYSLKKIDEALKKGNGIIVLNVHSFNHFALQILLQKKYNNISTIVMDTNAHIFFNNSKANICNKFYRYDDKNLFFKLRKELNDNKIIIIHQDLINLGTRQIEVNFMETKIHLLENIAAYLSFYSSYEIISSYTVSCGGIFTKVKFANFIIDKNNAENIKRYVEMFHKCTAKYIESFVRKFPHQWMGWQYFRFQMAIEPAEKAFLPDFIFFDGKIRQWLFCNLYPLHLIKVKPSKVILYFYLLAINGIKSCCKKSGSYN
jgi:lauroyl/myristoyl acyltransferase